jgi:hypothetical protein
MPVHSEHRTVVYCIWCIVCDVRYSGWMVIMGEEGEMCGLMKKLTFCPVHVTWTPMRTAQRTGLMEEPKKTCLWGQGHSTAAYMNQWPPIVIWNGIPGTDPQFASLIFIEPNTVTHNTQTYWRTIALYVTNILLAHFPNIFWCTECLNTLKPSGHYMPYQL